jgi:lysophospholipase L1-like esterase
MLIALPIGVFLRRHAPGLTLAVLLAGHVTAVAAEPAARPDPLRWKEDIERLWERDQQTPPQPGGIVFIGSSSIRMWNLAASFPRRPTVNYGFGGSHLADTVHYLDRLVLPLHPKVLVVYAGDNDIHNGLSPEQVREDFDRLVHWLETKLPQTRLLYIAIKPSRARWPEFPRMQRANGLIAARCAESDRCGFVDIVPSMLGQDGEPRAGLFLSDGLHLNEEGYRVWTELLEKRLAAMADAPGG